MFLTRIARCRSVLPFCTMPVLVGDSFFFDLLLDLFVFSHFAYVICSMYSYLLIDVLRKFLCRDKCQTASKTCQTAPGLDWRTSPECRGRSDSRVEAFWIDTTIRLLFSCVLYCLVHSCLQNLSVQAVDHREQDRRAMSDQRCMIVWCINGPGARIESYYQGRVFFPLAIEY